MREGVVTPVADDAERELGLRDGFVSMALQVVEEDGTRPVQFESEVEPVGRFLDIGEAGLPLAEIPFVRDTDEVTARVLIYFSALGEETVNRLPAAEIAGVLYL